MRVEDARADSPFWDCGPLKFSLGGSSVLADDALLAVDALSLPPQTGQTSRSAAKYALQCAHGSPKSTALGHPDTRGTAESSS